MTAVTGAVPDQAELPDSHGATPAAAVRSEWTKFFSVRSTMWALISTFVFTVGFAALISWGVSTSYGQMSAQDRASFDATGTSLVGLTFSQLVIAVLGVLMISTEYSIGGIRGTFTAVPRRLRVLLAKAIVLAVVALAIGLLSCFTAFYVGQLFFASKHIEAHLGDPQVFRAVVGGGLYVAACALFGLAVGTVLRHTAGAVTATIALLIVVPPLTLLLPGRWGDAITRYFTSNAGQRIGEVVHTTNALGPWTGYAVFTAEWAAVLLLGAVLLVRRDA
jgi:ABC-2 type transport system permease protein